MSNDNTKKITIKFELDASGAENGGRKVTAVLVGQKEAVDKVTKSYSLLELAEKSYRKQIDAQEAAFGKLVTKIRELEKNTKLSQPLFEGAAKASVVGFNNLIDHTNTKLALTEERIKVLKFATNLGAASATSIVSTPSRANSISASSGLSVNTKTKTQVAAEEALLQEANERLRKVSLDTANDVVRQQDIANKKRISSYEKMFDNITAQEKAFADKQAAIHRTATLSAGVVQKDNRGYVPNAQGTVADNRTKALNAQEDLDRLVEQRLIQTRQREAAREEAHAVHQQKLAKETADRKLQILTNQIQTEQLFTQAARDSELAQQRRDSQKREDLRQEAIAKQVSSLQSSLVGNSAAHQGNIDRQIAVERYGLKSIEVARIEAANRTRQLQEQLANYIIRQQERVAQGTLSAQSALGRITNAQKQHAEGVLRANKALNAQEKALGSSVRSHDALLLRVGKLIISYNILRNVWGRFTSSIQAVPQLGIELQATQASLTSTIGSAAGAESALAALNTEAERTGINLGALRTSFRTFQASTSLAGESLNTTWRMFTNINTVATALHLTVDKTNNVFLALAQIFNKSKVQSEELVKQLGNLLPGAFASFQQANKEAFATTADLIKAMELGTVSAHETIAKFTEFMSNRFAAAFTTASVGINADIGRMQNAFIHLGEAIFATTEGPLVAFIRGITSATNYVTEGVKGLNTFSTVLTVTTNAALYLTVGLLGSLILKLGSVVLNTVKVSGALIALKAHLGFLINPTTIIAGIALIGYELYKLGKVSTEASDNVNNFLRTKQKLRDDARAGKLTLDIEADPDVKAGVAALEQARKAVAELKKEITRGGELTAKAGIASPAKVTKSHSLLELSDRYKIAATQLKVESAKLERVEEELAISRDNARIKLQAGYNAANIEQLDTQSRARRQLLIANTRKEGNEELAARMQVEDQYASFLKHAQLVRESILKTPISIRSAEASKDLQQAEDDIKAYTFALENASRKADTAVKENKDLYDELAADTKSGINSLKLELKGLDYAYEDNLISIEKYFQEKTRLIEKDLELQIAYNDQSQAIAAQQGDDKKLKELEAARQEIFEEAGIRNTENLREELRAKKEYNDVLLEIKANSLAVSGKEVEAGELRINAEYLQKEKLLRANNNEEALRQLDTTKKAALAQNSVVELLRKEQTKRNELQNKEQSIQAQLDAGLISQRDAQDQLFASRIELLDVEDILILKLREQVALNKDNVILADQLREAEAKRIVDGISGIERPRYKGDFDFLNNFQDQQAKLDTSKKLETRAIDIFPDKSGEMYGKKLENQLDIDRNYALRATENYANLFSSIGSLGSNTFESLAAANAKMYGAQSKEARKAFLMYKATKMAEIAMSTAGAVMNALATSGNIYVGIALAAVSAAIGAVQLAVVASQQPPAAHGGLDYVPKEQTYLLDKGERVLSPKQNTDFTSFISKQKSSTSNAFATPEKDVNVKIINNFSEELFSEWASSAAGERVIMNTVRRNRETI